MINLYRPQFVMSTKNLVKNIVYVSGVPRGSFM